MLITQLFHQPYYTDQGVYMAKEKSVFVCQACGRSYPKWIGQCSECHEWNTLVEERISPGVAEPIPQESLEKNSIVLPRVEALSASKSRFSTTIDELDRVLGGEKGRQGMVPGAVMLIGGEPGIGKSTLLTQVVVGLLKKGDSATSVLYVAGEESPSQISLRIQRIIAGSSKKTTPLSNLPWAKGLRFVTSTDVGVLVAAVKEYQPSLIVVDSIQTITTTDLSGAAGSVGQIRESAERLTKVAKQYNVPVFLVGHVTKEGELAGPKVLEHIVDSVLELSGERRGDFRLLRAVKNRFGATDEVGVFKVTEFGYDGITNPSELFIEHAETQVPGSATICVMEGTRPLLLEVQSLVVQSQLALPRRVGRGVELSRLQLLAAVLQKHCGLPLGSSDIFASIAGGFVVREPVVDLGLAVAIASSLKNKPLPAKTVFLGEVGLLGEIRAVSYFDRRQKEAQRVGFEHIISRENFKSVRDVLKHCGLLR